MGPGMGPGGPNGPMPPGGPMGRGPPNSMGPMGPMGPRGMCKLFSDYTNCQKKYLFLHFFRHYFAVICLTKVYKEHNYL